MKNLRDIMYGNEPVRWVIYKFMKEGGYAEH